jgi:hypothetical protein
VTLYWLKESILKNWLLGFLPHEGFPRYIYVLGDCLCFSDPITCNVNEC